MLRLLLLLLLTPTTINALSVTVVGGTGFVGSRVCAQLVEKGASVTSISQGGQVPSWCKDEAWVEQVKWTKLDLLNDPQEDALQAAIGTPDALVSCVGVVGTDRDVLLQGNGATNVAAFGAAPSSVKRTALVSVASEVSDLDGTFWLPDFFSGYFEGKAMAETAALEAGECTIVRPSFIYGGPSFGLLPPRVNDEYGSGVEELLSLGLFGVLADITPGLIKVALRPPSSVNAVAAACAAAAMGEIPAGTILEGADVINKATNQPKATGLTEALEWAKENSVNAYDWAKEEVPKAVDWTKAKIEEVQKK